MKLDEKKKKKKKSEPKGLWYHVNNNKKAGKRPKRPGEKGYPDSKTWKKLTGKNESVEKSLRILIRETIVEMGITAPLAWGRDLAPTGMSDDPYAGKEEWEIEHYEEFGEWPEVDRQDWSDADETTFDETSGGADRPLSSIR